MGHWATVGRCAEGELVLEQARGGRASVVREIVAGGYSSAFLTAAPDEFPEQRGNQLLDRCGFLPLPHFTLVRCPLRIPHRLWWLSKGRE